MTDTTATTDTTDTAATAETAATTDTAAMTAVEGAAERLLAAVRAGRHTEVPALLEPLDAAARKRLLPRLKELRAEVRGWDWQQWTAQTEARRALRVAGAACHTGPAAAATWIASRDLTGWGGHTVDGLLDVLADREPAWLADVAGRLAARPGFADDEYRLVRTLVERAGGPVPTTEGYLRGWIRAVTDHRLTARLREDPQTPVLLPHVLALTETPDRLTWSVGPDAPTHWPTALKTLADEGVLDRAVLVDGCVSRLLRGGRARDLRFPLALLQILGTTDEERRARVPDWLGMAADGPSPVAGHAQAVLTELALDGGLTVGELAEMSGSVLFRSEKKLVRAQLTLLGKVLRRDPGAAPELLPAVTDAFGHEDTAVQERVLALVGRHLKHVDDGVRAELAGSVELLSPVHRQAAAELFGVAAAVADEAPYEEVLPPAPERRPVAPPAGTVAELVADLVALERRPYEDPEAFERALDGLVRHAHRDREALKAAVREAFAGSHRLNSGRHTSALGSHGLTTVLAALLGLVRPGQLDAARRRRSESASCAHTALGQVIDARVWETAWLVITEKPVPFLLAAPTWHTGAIDPAVLVERLREYRDAGVDPLPLDLAQALLRVRKGGSEAADAAAGAAALGTRAGDRLAEWLTADETLSPGLRFLARSGDDRSGRWWLADRLVVAVRERRAIRDEFPAAFHWLGSSVAEHARGCAHWPGSGRRPLWPAVLPDDRETFAAWLLPVLAAGARGEERDVAEGLTALAEADGPVGPAVHCALAVALGFRHVEDRLTAVDALLVLASRGELDAGLLGARLAELLAEGTVKPNRLADSARTAAATGAYRTVGDLLLALLPSVLGGPGPVRGTGELLAVAAECVERAGGSGEVPGLAELAARKGSTQLVTQARRLAVALGQGADQDRSETA
ncbi:DUF6493 family protein [Streptomyces sp. NPDC053541]|uniref:DUF7824 domain-containing protein n=1 Tax=Streptomyces sp. NPDC053541 TaxID=3365709 RepID=UPI0037D8055C